MRLIDAEVLANWIDGSQRLDTEHDYEEVARYIEECPTVDAVPVVRCRDCKYWDRTWTTHSGWHFCPMIGFQTATDWFCADGEHMDGGESDDCNLL